MANSTQSVISDGTLSLLDVSISYLDRSSIEVLFNGVADVYPWSWVGATQATIAFSPPVPIGVEVRLRRVTNVDKVRHEFDRGAEFSEATLDENFQQILQVAQEFQEGAKVTDIYNDLNMHGYRIINQLATSGEGFIWKGDWQAGATYGVNNMVYVPSGAEEGSSFIAKVNHVAGANFSTDLAADRWERMSKRGAAGPGSGDLVAANNLSDILNKAVALQTLGGVPLIGGTMTGDLEVPYDAYDALLWAMSNEVPTKRAIRDKLESLRPGVLAGTIIIWPGKTVPSGYVICPFGPTQVNRVGPYADVFANIGTSWGAGDGVNTFNLPYFPENFTAIHAAAGNVGTLFPGQIQLHAHLTYLEASDSQLGSGSAGTYPVGSDRKTGVRVSSRNTGEAGGDHNLPAGSRIMYCMKL